MSESRVTRSKKSLVKDSLVIWITGFSGAGKTTLAKSLKAEIFNNLHINAIHLDGDELRAAFDAETNTFDKKSRLNLALTYARLTRLLAMQGNIVIVSTISMFSEVYEWNRLNQPNFFEIFLDIPFDELTARNSKGLYSDVRGNPQPDVAGVDVSCDLPDRPDLILDSLYNGQTMSEICSAIFKDRA